MSTLLSGGLALANTPRAAVQLLKDNGKKIDLCVFGKFHGMSFD